MAGVHDAPFTARAFGARHPPIDGGPTRTSARRETISSPASHPWGARLRPPLRRSAQPAHRQRAHLVVHLDRLLVPVDDDPLHPRQLSLGADLPEVLEQLLGDAAAPERLLDKEVFEAVEGEKVSCTVGRRSLRMRRGIGALESAATGPLQDSSGVSPRL